MIIDLWFVYAWFIYVLCLEKFEKLGGFGKRNGNWYFGCNHSRNASLNGIIEKTIHIERLLYWKSQKGIQYITLLKLVSVTLKVTKEKGNNYTPHRTIICCEVHVYNEGPRLEPVFHWSNKWPVFPFWTGIFWVRCRYTLKFVFIWILVICISTDMLKCVEFGWTKLDLSPFQNVFFTSLNSDMVGLPNHTWNCFRASGNSQTCWSCCYI